ncbi:MAG: hypothetical protein COB85_03575 [Bacteroidetes bacterium]|nr:MAG: hypothetical protein COB85_03575 [Bacteroidota bacterium]
MDVWIFAYNKSKNKHMKALINRIGIILDMSPSSTKIVNNKRLESILFYAQIFLIIATFSAMLMCFELYR